MLYIINIDDNTFSLHGDSIGIAGLKVISKKNLAAKAHEPVYNESQGRVSIYNTFNKKNIVDRTPISEITVDDIVYETAQELVVAVNGIIGEAYGIANIILPEDLILTYDGLGVIFNEDGTKVLTFNGFMEY
jgi:hypothetical protein